MPILTEIRIRAARPKERAYNLFALRGLFMLVIPTGGRLWRFRYPMPGSGPDESLDTSQEIDCNPVVESSGASNLDTPTKQRPTTEMRQLRHHPGESDCSLNVIGAKNSVAGAAGPCLNCY
jgi:hypothetical protein